MIEQPHPETQSDPAARQGEHTQYYLRVLHEVIDMAVDLAQHVQAHGKAAMDARAASGDAPTGPVADGTVAFDRMARVIRRTVMLAQRVAAPVPVRAAADPARQDAAGRRAAARRRIIRDVEDTIQREAWGTEAESLRDELFERLDGPDLEDDIDTRPAAEIVADICRDLGIAGLPGAHPWARRTPDDIAELCARAAGICPQAETEGFEPGEAGVEAAQAGLPPLDSVETGEGCFRMVACADDG